MYVDIVIDGHGQIRGVWQADSPDAEDWLTSQGAYLQGVQDTPNKYAYSSSEGELFWLETHKVWP